MYDFIQKLHSGWAYVVLLFLILAVINAFIGFSSKKTFSGKDRTIYLLAMLFTHFQLLIGMVLYFVSPLGKASFGQMGNAPLRLTSLEHPLVNIIAIILITIGWSKHKRLNDSQAKFKTFIIFYGIGLLLLLSRIPWELWFR